MVKTMLATALQRLHAQGFLDVERVAQDTGLDPSTIHSWISGRKKPRATSLRSLFRSLSAEGQQALLSWLTSGLPWVHTRLPSDLDLNGDGVVDTNDALDATIGALDRVATALRQLRVMNGNSKVTEGDQVNFDGDADAVIRGLVVAKQIVAVKADETRSRIKNRPIVLTPREQTPRA